MEFSLTIRNHDCEHKLSSLILLLFLLFKHIFLTKFALRLKKLINRAHFEITLNEKNALNSCYSKRQQNKENIKGMLAGAKFIFRYFYKISLIQI